MVFFIGVICGIGVALAVRGILLAAMPRSGVEKPGPLPRRTAHGGWEETRNFLYYDGTVMPTSKEDPNEQ